MARGPRLTFAAPLVVVVSAGAGAGAGAGCGSGSSSSKPAPPPALRAWRLQKQRGACVARPEVRCPPPTVATCNPPPAIPIACVDGDPPPLRIVEVASGRCTVDGGDRVVPCPSYEDIPPPPPTAVDAAVAAVDVDAASAEGSGVRRGWSIVRDGSSCVAMDDGCTRYRPPAGQPLPPCNPPAPIAIPCPDPDAVAIIEITPGHCMTRYDFHCPPSGTCNPPEPIDVACPTR